MDKNTQRTSSTKFEVPVKDKTSFKLSLKINIRGIINNWFKTIIKVTTKIGINNNLNLFCSFLFLLNKLQIDL